MDAATFAEVSELALRVGEARSLPDVGPAVVRFLCAHTPANGVFVAALDPATRMRRCLFAWSAGAPVPAETLPPLPLNDSPVSRAIVSGKPVVTRDFQAALASQFKVDVNMHIDPRAPRSSLAVPVLAGGEAVGSLELQSSELGAFDDGHVALAQAVAGLLAPLVARPAAPEPPGADHGLARGLARELLQRLMARGHMRPEVLRELGREMGGTIKPQSLDDAARAYVAMGLGELRVVAEDESRAVVEGHDLLERGPLASQPTCLLTLGFLEGAWRAPDRRVLGAEVACESQGAKACAFVLQRRRGEPPR